MSFSDVGVYKIRCLGWNTLYIGETSRNLYKRLYDLKKFFKWGITDNSLVSHNSSTNHAFDFLSYLLSFAIKMNVEYLKPVLYLILIQFVQRQGFYIISPSFSKMILNDFYIDLYLLYSGSYHVTSATAEVYKTPCLLSTEKAEAEREAKRQVWKERRSVKTEHQQRKTYNTSLTVPHEFINY